MKPFLSALALLGAVAASPAMAEVKSATLAGFEVEAKVVVPAAPAEAYAALARIGAWWSSAHTYSGDAANMTLDPKVGGCFCETIPKGNGAIEHGRVIYAQPGETLRLQGGLGPLQAEAALGVLTWALKPAEDGTEITQTYIVGGYMRSGGAALAPIVDRVLAEQLQGLRAYLSR
ncbi:MAG TPA: SRPBCC family protein [Allosphingosinicella sp.]